MNVHVLVVVSMNEILYIHVDMYILYCVNNVQIHFLIHKIHLDVENEIINAQCGSVENEN
jgi:hypothetical protein